MAKRTKAELEAENTSLRIENEILRGNLRDSLDEVDLLLKRLRLMDNVSKADLQRHIEVFNTLGARVEASQRGSIGNQQKAENKHTAFLEEYDCARGVGATPVEAMEKANNMLPDYGYKPYKDKDGRHKQLKELLKKHRSQDWS
jgi:hypothetical protein